LSEKFDIEFQKWKRWSREFLPPEKIRSLAKGYAREYSQNEAFIVLLGGHLVSALDFSIPDAKKIIEDLTPFFNSKGLFPSVKNFRPAKKDKLVKGWKVTIYPDDQLGFDYTARGHIDEKTITYKGESVHQEIFVEENITTALKLGESKKTNLSKGKLLDISFLLTSFQLKLEGRI
jgi:hypothetical protein